MKHEIKTLEDIEVDSISVRLPNNRELMNKINEIINYLNNDVIIADKTQYQTMVGILKTSSD